MEVIFYFSCSSAVSQESRLAEIMVASCKQHMPDAVVTQLTDPFTEEVPGVDNIHRYPARSSFAEGQAYAFAEYAREGLYVDTDVVFRDDVSEIWDKKFDFAARRTFEGLSILDAPGVFDTNENAAIRMPYNMGIVFCRDTTIWNKVIEGAPDIDWYEGQIAFGQLSINHTVLDLDESYHFVPNYLLHDMSFKKIVHFKGPKRKRWMTLLYGNCPLSLGALKKVIKYGNNDARPATDSGIGLYREAV